MGKNKWSRRSIDRMNGLKSILIVILTEGLETSPYDFGIPKDGGRRTLARQKELYAIGRTTDMHRSPITWTLDSNHLPDTKDGLGNAFDIFAYVDKKASWDLKYLEPIARNLQAVADKYGYFLEWGQDLWGKDGAHFQLRKW